MTNGNEQNSLVDLCTKATTIAYSGMRWHATACNFLFKNWDLMPDMAINAKKKDN
jgi:hypothetical protein